MLSSIVLVSAAVALAQAAATTGERLYGSIGKQMMAQSNALPKGDFYFKNVATGEVLTYNRESGQSLFPSNGKGSLISVAPRGADLAVLSPKDSNQKCVSAQWNYDADKNQGGFLYACRIGFKKRSSVEERAVALRLKKQEWLGLPGCAPGSWSILANDHLTDMKTQALVGGCKEEAVYEKGSYGICLRDYDAQDCKHSWYLITADGKTVGPDGTHDSSPAPADNDDGSDGDEGQDATPASEESEAPVVEEKKIAAPQVKIAQKQAAPAVKKVAAAVQTPASASSSSPAAASSSSSPAAESSSVSSTDRKCSKRRRQRRAL